MVGSCFLVKFIDPQVVLELAVFAFKLAPAMSTQSKPRRNPCSLTQVAALILEDDAANDQFLSPSFMFAELSFVQMPLDH